MTRNGTKSANAHITLLLNGEDREISFAPYKTLLEVLREDAGLMGTKHGCELGECGACAVLLDGRSVLSCLVLGLECEGREVVTVEGIDVDGKLHPLQDAFADLGAAQCGYCTPGILVTAKALIEKHPNPTREQIKEALSGNICRCTGYLQIFDAVEAAILSINGKRGLSAEVSLEQPPPKPGAPHATGSPRPSSRRAPPPLAGGGGIVSTGRPGAEHGGTNIPATQQASPGAHTVSRAGDRPAGSSEAPIRSGSEVAR